MPRVEKSGRVRHRFWQEGPGYDRNLYRGKSTWEEIARRYAAAHPDRIAYDRTLSNGTPGVVDHEGHQAPFYPLFSLLLWTHTRGHHRQLDL